jgi:PIN domain nuclease of toxin-antitoxin system
VSLLLDTHVALWWLADDPSLSDEIKTRLDHEPDVYVSAASIWEVAIKQAIGKLEPADLPERIRDSGFPGVAYWLRACHRSRAPPADSPQPV